jgi:hypothetical protein
MDVGQKVSWIMNDIIYIGVVLEDKGLKTDVITHYQNGKKFTIKAEIETKILKKA